jgi:hypothetical protein
MLQRQVIAVLPAAWFLAHLWQHRTLELRPLLRAALRSALPIGVTIAAYMAYVAYLRAGPGLPDAQAMHNGRLGEYVIAMLHGDPFRWAVTKLWFLSWLGYFGFALLALAFFWVGRARLTPGAKIVLLALSCTYGATIAYMGGSLPFRENNVVDALGIGPFTLIDGLHTHPFNQLIRPSGGVWFWVTMAASVGVAASVFALLHALLRALRSRASERMVPLFLAIALSGYSFAFIVTDYIDRYIFFVLPLAIALLSSAFPALALRLHTGPTRKWSYALPALVIALAGAWSVAGTHDYFAWNRARWAAIDLAHSQGAKPDTLDAGFEYNGRYRFEAEPRQSVAGKSWWWVADDAWIVSFAPRAHYSVVQTFPVNAQSHLRCATSRWSRSHRPQKRVSSAPPG